MANYTLNLTSPPSGYHSDIVFNQGGFTFVSNRLISNPISHNQQTSGYIKFEAEVGSVSATIGVSSEGGCDFMSLHVSTSSTPPGRNEGNMANISGERSELTYFYKITVPGTYYLHFYYAKDGSVNRNEDIGWITKVSLPMKTRKEHIKVNDAWIIPKSKYVNINGTWVGSTTYANINNSWVNIVQYGGPVNFKIAMTSIQHNSTYGHNYVGPDYCQIASGYNGYGKCAIRSTHPFSLKAGDSIRVNILHATLPNGGSFSTDKYGQTGRVCLSTSSTFPSLGIATGIYGSTGTPGLNNYNSYQYDCTSDFTNVYLWMVLDDDFFIPREDTYLIMNKVWVNETVVYP